MTLRYQMSKFFSILFSLLFACLLLSLVVLFIQRESFSRWALEKLLNVSTQEIFQGTVTLQKVSMDRFFQIHLQGFEAVMKTEKEKVPLKIQSVDSEGSLPGLLMGGSLVLHIQGVSFGNAGNLSNPFQMQAVFTGMPKWELDLRGTLKKYPLENLQWADPVNLQNATGKISGHFRIRQGLDPMPVIESHIQIPKPGGQVQSRFFDMVLPYLPQTASRETLKMIQSQKVVAYEDAALTLQTLNADTLKLFFHIFVPSYNLVMNVNVKVRIDKNNAFLEAARVLGLVQIQNT